MKCYRLWFILITLFFHVIQIQLTAGNRYRLIDTRNGLFNNQVRFITEMQDGRILVLTEGMFNVYNGHKFESLACDLNYTIPLGMHNICTAYETSDGLMWVKDYYRLYLFNTRTGRFCHDIKEHFKAARLTEPINDFVLDNDGNAWIITENGNLYRYDWNTPAKIIYTNQTNDNGHVVKAKDVMQAGPFHLIFLNTGEILCYEDKSGRIVSKDSTVADGIPSQHFRTTWCTADDRHLLISVSHGEGMLYTYNIYTREWNVILRNKAINDIKKKKDGTYILGGNNTLIYLSADFKVLHEENYFNLTDGNRYIQDYILSVLIDHQDGLWLGMGSKGVLKAMSQEKHLSYYTNTETTESEGRAIRCLRNLDDCHLLVGTMKGIYLFNTRNNSYKPFLPEFSTSYCTDIKYDPKGRLWLSTRQGLYCMYEGTITRHDQNLPQKTKNDITRFTLPLSDGQLLVCLDLRDFYLYNPETQTGVRLNEIYPRLQRSRAMSFAIEIKPGQLLIGGQNCLFGYEIKKNKLEEVEWIRPWEKYSIKYNCAYSYDSIVWIGTQNGLIRHNFKSNQSIRFDTSDGLPNNCIQGITCDADSILWISTSNGIGLIKEEKNGTFSITRLMDIDGIQNGEMMEQSITVMPNKHVYVGGIYSITDIPTEAFKDSKLEFPPMLVGIKIMNQSINNEGTYNGRLLLPKGLSYTRTLKLKYNENFLEMKFSAQNYDTPQHTRYRYFLEGVDREWNYSSEITGICTAVYTSLEPGTYNLKVQAATGSNTWEKESEWKIIVEPPFWRTWWMYTLYISLILLAFFHATKTYLSVQKTKIKTEQDLIKRQKEQHLDELKFRFFTNISHEFRTPLALIITPLEMLIRRTEDSSLKNELQKILKNAKELLRLVNQLLDFRRLEQKGEQLKLSEVQIKPFIEENVNLFSELAQKNKITLECECCFTPEDYVCLDRGKTIRIINNLLSNAIKFTPEKGNISIESGWMDSSETDEKESGIYIKVNDSGIGIKPEELQHIFTRFYQTENQETTGLNTGSGIGLHLTKGYVELMGGHIHVESSLGKGTCFTVFIPKQTSENNNIEETENTATKEQESFIPDKACEKTQNTILIAEDNEHFRSFMKELLKNEFNILTASDGHEGINKAREYNPDLIISDIMMPGMDGYEFCRHIKTDMKCSHIPFILLTAKNSSESRSGAYEAGADSFIAKPFDIDVLTSRIHQLLEQRNHRQDFFKREININPKEITITDLDERLIQKILECMEKNMSNSEYNVEALSMDMGIERTSLYRKMQAIAGQTPSEFMRTIRLKRAAQLLENSKYSVQEISWMVGFNTPRYFSSYFKEMFGVTPSKYMHKKGETE